jgi:hypothetical protein
VLLPPPGLGRGTPFLTRSASSLWAVALLSDPGGVLAACLSVTKTAAFRYVDNVGFCPVPRTYPATTMSTISGHNQTACSLAKYGFGLPLPGLSADFPPDLLAKLWSGGTLTVWDQPLGNIIEFHGHKSNPTDLGLTRRDYIACIECLEEGQQREIS